MAQISLYVDEATMQTLRERAQKNGHSVSHYVAGLIRQNESSAWPDEFWNTYGALADESFTAPAELDSALDAPRASFD